MSKRRNSAPRVVQKPKLTRYNRPTIVPDLAIVNEEYVKQKRRVELIPKSLNQETYINLLTDPNKRIVFATGPAGTGKTMLAVMAAIKAYREGDCNKIIVTRPAVGVDDEEHGFLPGDLNQKMEPWTRPIMDVFSEYYKQAEITKMLDDQIIEVSPLAFMRGRNFRNSWIIFDEAQNATSNQMKMVLTRLGEGSKLVVTGDLQQTDRKFTSDNGLRDFVNRITGGTSTRISAVIFAGKDIQRDPVVAEVLKIYGEV